MQVAVLGGGLQGACVALELATAGIAVDLYDRQEAFVTQASAQNEGKLHLGYVYANDATRRTARTMIQGALAFLPLLRRWLGSACERVAVARPFNYLVHRESLLSVAEVESHFRAAHAILMEESCGMPLDYFGSAYHPPLRLSAAEAEACSAPQAVQAAYRTAEIGIDPEALAALVRERLAAEPKIRGFTRAHVKGVTPADDGVTVLFESGGQTEVARYDHVVNALWDGRLAVDLTAGVPPPRPWLYRIKYYVRMRSHAPTLGLDLPSTTIVLGPFGDIAAYGRDAYLSWYPAGMRGLSSALSPPAWPRVLDGPSAHEMRRRILDGLAQVVPAVAALGADTAAVCEVRGGIIFASGQTDIDDPSSGLHERHAIGPRSFGRYHTVDTGKLTMAPLYGKRVADHIQRMG